MLQFQQTNTLLEEAIVLLSKHKNTNVDCRSLISKVGSTKNIRHTAGGGDIKVGLVYYNLSSVLCTDVTRSKPYSKTLQSCHTKKLQYRISCLFQIHDEKVEFRVGSRIGSLANVKVKPKSCLVIVKECVILLDRIIKLAIAYAWVSC